MFKYYLFINQIIAKLHVHFWSRNPSSYDIILHIDRYDDFKHNDRQQIL